MYISLGSRLYNLQGMIAVARFSQAELTLNLILRMGSEEVGQVSANLGILIAIAFFSPNFKGGCNRGYVRS